ncbi:MAG: hypothetical protein ACOC8K_01610 [Gemmatimonadota bacterium]
MRREEDDEEKGVTWRVLDGGDRELARIEAWWTDGWPILASA